MKRQKVTIKKEAFIKYLKICGNVSSAARKAKISRQYAYRLRRKNPEFAKAWDEAMNFFLDNLEGEIHRRGFKGVLEPLIYKGQVCGTIRKFSDKLALRYLAAHRSNWRTGTVVDQRKQTAVFGNMAPPQHLQDAAHPPPRPATMEAWEEQVRAARARRKQLALEAPPQSNEKCKAVHNPQDTSGFDTD